jgi:hypothetical protein
MSNCLECTSPPSISNTHASDKPRLLDQVRNAIRCKHYSIRTEHSYLGLDKTLHTVPQQTTPTRSGRRTYQYVFVAFGSCEKSGQFNPEPGTLRDCIPVSGGFKRITTAPS